MIPDEINKQIENAFSSEMRGKYHLVYTDCNDSFNYSAETIHECIEKKDSAPLLESLDDKIVSHQNEMCNEIMEEMKDKIMIDSKYADIHQYLEEWFENDDNREQLRFKIVDRDSSEPVSEMIVRTNIRARVTQYSNFDALPDNWSSRNIYHYSDYFKDIVDTLYLNPAIVKKTFVEKGISAVGKFPNLACRNGKEAVEYSVFADELLNQSCYCRLVFMGLLPLQTLYDNDFGSYHKIVIPKGNNCGFFNDWNGGGSLLGMELKRDLVLPVQIPQKTEYDRFCLEVDERNCGTGYCIDEVYGLIREAWGKEIQLIYKP